MPDATRRTGLVQSNFSTSPGSQTSRQSQARPGHTAQNLKRDSGQGEIFQLQAVSQDQVALRILAGRWARQVYPQDTFGWCWLPASNLPGKLGNAAGMERGTNDPGRLDKISWPFQARLQHHCLAGGRLEIRHRTRLEDQPQLDTFAVAKHSRAVDSPLASRGQGIRIQNTRAVDLGEGQYQLLACGRPITDR